MNKIGVIAGTLVDTQMGVDFLKTKGITGIGKPAAKGTKEQTLMQVLSAEELTKKIEVMISELKEEGIEKAMIYCNSLSVAINIDELKKRVPEVKIVTPLDIYKKLAKDFDRITIIAANGQSLAGIEKIFYQENKDLDTIGLSIMPIIVDIEANVSPEKIIDKYKLQYIEDLSKAFNSQGVLLGCTHLPYFKKELEEKVQIELIDPAELMLEELNRE